MSAASGLPVAAVFLIEAFVQVFDEVADGTGPPPVNRSRIVPDHLTGHRLEDREADRLIGGRYDDPADGNRDGLPGLSVGQHKDELGVAAAGHELEAVEFLDLLRRVVHLSPVRL